MSLQDSIAVHWEDIARKKATLVEALSWSATGRNIRSECNSLAKSKVLKKLLKALASEKGNPIDRFKMAQYLTLALEHNPDYELHRFVNYLDIIIRQSTSPRRAEYYSELKQSVLAFNGSEELRHYVRVHEEFQKDHSKEATLAREIMKEVSFMTHKMMGQYA